MNTINRRQLLQATAALAVTSALVADPITTPMARAHGTGGWQGKLPEPQSLDGRPFPAYDYTRANKLPREMTGYWTKSFDIGGVTRTAKIYLSPDTPIRSYYTVIAVPDGADTAEFLHRTSWAEVADRREEGLFVLEPAASGWGDAASEAAYVEAAMAFYQSNRYFSIFGLHYLVGYGGGAPALEAWAVAHPLRVISQVYLDSPGLNADYLNLFGPREFDGDTDASYTTVDFPEGFDLIRYDETVLPTWYINNPEPNSIGDSLAYWKRANDTADASRRDGTLGRVFRQRRQSSRWMTSHSGPISQVAVRDRPTQPLSRATTHQIIDFLTFYTRYENFFAYGNQIYERADYRRLGIEVRTMMVEGFIREYLVYVPRSARAWRSGAPVVFVWPGNSQTDKVFLDATQWWKVAEREGFILVVICEQYSNTSVSVSHRDSKSFFQQLRQTMINEYPVDPTRFYSTGHSAGSRVTQNFAIAFPEYFAAVASTSFTAAPDASGTITMDGVAHPASGQMIPNFHLYGYGDLPFIAGGLWDETQNRLDSWAAYHLQVNGLELSDVDDAGGAFSGWYDRHQTWTWRDRDTSVPVLKLTKNVYRSHNTLAEESPLLWDFLKHYSHEIGTDGNLTRYYSESGFRRPADRVRLL